MQHQPTYGDVVTEYRVKSRDTFGLESPWSDWAVHSETVKPGAAPAAIQLRVSPGIGQ